MVKHLLNPPPPPANSCAPQYVKSCHTMVKYLLTPPPPPLQYVKSCSHVTATVITWARSIPPEGIVFVRSVFTQLPLLSDHPDCTSPPLPLQTPAPPPPPHPSKQFVKSCSHVINTVITWERSILQNGKYLLNLPPPPPCKRQPPPPPAICQIMLTCHSYSYNLGEINTTWRYCICQVCIYPTAALVWSSWLHIPPPLQTPALPPPLPLNAICQIMLTCHKHSDNLREINTTKWLVSVKSPPPPCKLQPPTPLHAICQFMLSCHSYSYNLGEINTTWRYCICQVCIYPTPTLVWSSWSHMTGY